MALAVWGVEHSKLYKSPLADSNQKSSWGRDLLGWCTTLPIDLSRRIGRQLDMMALWFPRVFGTNSDLPWTTVLDHLLSARTRFLPILPFGRRYDWWHSMGLLVPSPCRFSFSLHSFGLHFPNNRMPKRAKVWVCTQWGREMLVKDQKREQHLFAGNRFPFRVYALFYSLMQWQSPRPTLSPWPTKSLTIAKKQTGQS
jgi:hypothetical protein